MTILFPSALVLLFFIGVPILIHILNRLVVTKINFSTIRFIKNLENNAIKKLKLKKLILLLLRISTIVALVIMLARPVTKGFISGWFAAELDSRLLLVIDNSSTMSGKLNGITLIESSKNAAMLIPQIYNENTIVNVVKTCPPTLLFTGKSDNPSLPEIISNINPTVGYDNLWEVVDSLTNSINATEPNKECIIFSDFQNQIPIKNKFEKSWKFYLINSGQISNNLSINSLKVTSRIKVPNQLLKIKTTINNSGNKDVSNTPVDLLFNGNRVGQVISEFEKGSNKEFIFQAYPEQKGVLIGSIHLPNDDYINDNIRYVTSPILNKINCLIIGNSDDELSLFKLIIDAIDPDKQLINLELRKQPIVNRLFVEDVDILIIHNPEAFTEAAFNELDIFLQQGGGLIWFAGGMEIDPSYNKYFSSFSFPKARKMIESGSASFGVNIPDRDTHILSDVNIRKLENELPEFYRYIKHSRTNKHNIHMQLDNGDPILLEFLRGSGSIFYFTSLVNLAWNNMPVRGLLVPLMYRLIVLGGTDELNSSSVIIGEPKWVVLDQNEVRDTWEVVSPSGYKNLIVPDFSKESIQIKSTDELGVYSIYQNGKHYTSFSTHLHPYEALFNTDPKNQIREILSSDKYKWIDLDNDFLSNFSNTRQGKSLWKLFLLLASILILIETWVGRPMPKNTE